MLCAGNGVLETNHVILAPASYKCNRRKIKIMLNFQRPGKPGVLIVQRKEATLMGSLLFLVEY